MIYVIDGKHYILVSGHYKEVEVKKNGKNYDIVPVKNAKKIEASTVKQFTTTDVENAVRKKLDAND
jgi:hypothetical protein